MRTALKTIILLILTVAFVTACAPQETEIFDEELVARTDKIDLEGVTIKYYRDKMGQHINNSDDEILGYEPGTVMGDLAMKRIKDVQNDLNCKFDIVYFSGDSPYTGFTMYNSTGSYFCDIFCGVSDRFRQSMKAGALKGLSELEDYLDYRNEEKWGRRNILEVLYWEDDVFGLIPMLWPTSSVSYQGMTIINEDLIASVGADDPRDLYENRQWTWATFRDCLERYYVKEGNEVKHYALTSQYTGDLGQVYVLSNGYRLAVKGKDGKYQSGMHDPRVITAMNEALDIAYGPLSYTIDVNVNDVDSMLAGNTVLGVLHAAEYMNRIVKNMPNFGVITWPSGPDVEPGFIATNHMNLERAIVLSRFSPYPEATAAALNALYEPFEEYPDTDAVKEFLFKTYFFDRRDADLYYDMFLNSQYSYFASAAWNTLHEWLEGKYAPAEYIESHLDKADQYIEEEVAPSKRGIEAVWGEE